VKKQKSAVSRKATATGQFPVVGIGASAGGLSAFESFFSGMPPDREPGMAFVLVQHLAPDHESILTDLIRRYTVMKVSEVTDGMRVEPNCAYIIPPNHDMAFVEGTLQLSPPAAPRGHRLPIDSFFRSLAQDQRERAICIVLSGTGSDGSEGARAIKSEGGMVMVQEPSSTEFDGMPRSTIATGLADYVLPPGEMATQLIAYVTHAFDQALKEGPVETPGALDALHKMFTLLRSQTGHDFSQYKPNTIRRRVERRMAVHQIGSIEDYVALIQQTPQETQALMRDLMIGVTGFFRDPECFVAFEEQVVPKLFEGKPPGAAIRAWSAGCSTGEEAYSIAMLIHEQLENLAENYSVQLFATDIDSRAIATARSGIYPSAVAADMSPERLSRYFTADDDGERLRVRRGLRDMLVFSEQDLIKDPPFSKLDLIICRNLLIYMGPELQRKIIPQFHYALNPGGFLFLGNSETAGEFGELFTAVNRKSRIYQRREHPRIFPRAGRGALYTATEQALAKTTGAGAARPKPRLREITEQALLHQSFMAAALVNENGDILYLHGRTGKYLEPAPGIAGVSNVLNMAREGLRHALVEALKEAVKDRETVHRPGLTVKTNGDFTSVHLTVSPVTARTDLDSPVYLVTMEESGVPVHGRAGSSPPQAEPSQDAGSQLEALRQELKEKEEYLQTAFEELETTNEELKSSNEEMQSVNEELQSTNEELETSKEELQSVNEELASLNVELQTKLADLSRVNNDMNNLLSGTGIGTVFVDRELRILRFTPAVTQIINLIPGDTGRPVGHIASNLVGYDRLVDDARIVLDTLVPKEVEVQTADGRWYTLRILPYRTLDNVIEGVVVTFFDVTDMKHAQSTIEKLLKEKELLLREVHHRIKNNMTTVKSLLALQADRLNDSSAREALIDAQTRINTMAVLYEKFYRTERFEALSLKTYLTPLIDDCLLNYPRKSIITLEAQVDDIQIDAEHLFPLGILLNELLTNILKYAFVGRESGKITVSAAAHDKHVTLVVGDDGNGIPESVDLENSTGFGLRLVGMLATQIGGTIRIERGNGTRFVLEFDL